MKSRCWFKLMSNNRAECLRGLVCVLILWACTSHSNAGPIDEGYEYFCPNGNGMLIGNQKYLEGRVSKSYPDRNADDPSEFILSPPLYWSMVDCSSEQHFCLDITEKPSNMHRRIFVPRFPIVGRSYSYGDAVAFVSAAATSDATTIQVEVSQPRNEGRIVTKMTIRDKRGVVYIDGLNFWDPAAYESGQTCVLQSKTGLFQKVKIRVPKPIDAH